MERMASFTPTQRSTRSESQKSYHWYLILKNKRRKCEATISGGMDVTVIIMMCQQEIKSENLIVESKSLCCTVLCQKEKNIHLHSCLLKSEWEHSTQKCFILTVTKTLVGFISLFPGILENLALNHPQLYYNPGLGLAQTGAILKPGARMSAVWGAIGGNPWSFAP